MWKETINLRCSELPMVIFMFSLVLPIQQIIQTSHLAATQEGIIIVGEVWDNSARVITRLLHLDWQGQLVHRRDLPTAGDATAPFATLSWDQVWFGQLREVDSSVRWFFGVYQQSIHGCITCMERRHPWGREGVSHTTGRGKSLKARLSRHGLPLRSECPTRVCSFSARKLHCVRLL